MKILDDRCEDIMIGNLLFSEIYQLNQRDHENFRNRNRISEISSALFSIKHSFLPKFKNKLSILLLVRTISSKFPLFTSRLNSSDSVLINHRNKEKIVIKNYFIIDSMMNLIMNVAYEKDIQNY